ncbi:MAG: DUF4912 domain-containing protein [Candidatus Krumholzibacteria bacterium]|jgi:hypothetical protein|nr:DUF4912 domain-containing protein [Candidatus Krumholzibacteria bacterium]
MTKAELEKMTKAELLMLAAKKNLKIPAGALKADIAAMLGRAGGGAVKKAAAKAPAAKAKGAAKRKPAAAVGKKKPAAAAVKSAAKKAAPKAVKKTGTKTSGKLKATAKTPSAAPAETVKKPAAKAAAASRPPVARAKTLKTGKPASVAPVAAPPAAIKPIPGSAADERSIRQKATEGKYQLTTGPVTMPPVESMEIPDTYDKTRIAMMVRDPYWLFTYWEISRASFLELESSLGEKWRDCRFVLRVYDRTDGEGFFDIETGQGSRSWYINVAPARLYQTAIGVMTPEGKFIELASSNVSGTPRAGVSEIVDDRWLVPDEEFERIFSASGGYASQQSGSGEIAREVERRFLEEMGSETVSSFGSAGLQKPARARAFRLWVATELILYGATEPDARVTIQGREIKLRGDGTFSARFALPDGVIDLPVTAVSHDEIEERTIETTVSRKSKEKAPVIR